MFPETKKCHSRRRAVVQNNSLIFCRLTVTLDLLAEELCSKACGGLIFPTHVEWKCTVVLFSKWFGRVLPALWLLSEAFHVFCHLADFWLACACGKQPDYFYGLLLGKVEVCKWKFSVHKTLKCQIIKPTLHELILKKEADSKWDFYCEKCLCNFNKSTSPNIQQTNKQQNSKLWPTKLCIRTLARTMHFLLH